MQRISSAFIVAAVSLAAIATAVPAQAASMRLPNGAATDSATAAGIQTVHDRRGHGDWRRGSRNHFSFGFGVPYARYQQPYAYPYPTYRCPYGYWYDQYRHACVGSAPYYYNNYPYQYRASPGVSVQFGF